MTNERHQLLSDTEYEQDTKRKRASDYFGGFPFQRHRYDEGDDTAICRSSLVVAVNHMVLSLNLGASAHHLFRPLMYAHHQLNLSYYHLPLFLPASHILKIDYRARRTQFLSFLPSLHLYFFSSCPNPSFSSRISS